MALEDDAEDPKVLEDEEVVELDKDVPAEAAEDRVELPDKDVAEPEADEIIELEPELAEGMVAMVEEVFKLVELGTELEE